MTNRRARILIVEDEKIVALDLKGSLKILGYEVVGTACSGPEAIAKALETRPDLVLMDIILKGEMDGIQASEAIRSQMNIPVIFLTACADDKTLERAKVTEPFGYLLKPFEERELHGHIEVALYKHSMEKKLRESEERYSLATQGANDGLWDWDLVSKEIYFSERWKAMLGYQDGQIGKSPDDWFERLHPADRSQTEKKLAQHVAGLSSHFESEYRILDASGAYRWMLCRGLALRNPAGKACRIAGSQTDITDRKVYNPLTGMPNRILLMDRLERALMRVNHKESQPFAVFALDIDGLKMINDSLGCLASDKLLIEVARRIQGGLGSQDTVAHCGSEDFVLLREGINNARDAMIAASRLHSELELPFLIQGQTVYVTPATGITMGTREYTSPEDLLRDASTALRRAKSGGNGRCEIFDGSMRSSTVARLKLEADLRRAFEQGEFRVHYQPIVCLKTGKMAGLEALVRWQREDELVLPGDFLALAESTDLLIPLENWVLRESCRQVAHWQARIGASKPLTVNVNLCPKHLANPDLVKELGDVLQSTELDPRNLRVEITESALMDSSECVSKTMAQIRDLNIQLHMDDFGTGYSSLSTLHQFPIDTLKIDRSFVSKLGLHEETWKIVQAIVSLAKNLGMEVIAEGIENLLQLKMLQTLDCEYGQGYYFSKAMNPNEIESMICNPLPWELAFECSAPRLFAFAVGEKG